LGARVRELRTKAGFRSQEAFAFKAGVDRTSIGILERGGRGQKPTTLAMVAKALGMSVTELTKGL
jgi:transcriptional regulator with XRE-family HTH domain